MHFIQLFLIKNEFSFILQSFSSFSFQLSECFSFHIFGCFSENSVLFQSLLDNSVPGPLDLRNGIELVPLLRRDLHQGLLDELLLHVFFELVFKELAFGRDDHRSLVPLRTASDVVFGNPVFLLGRGGFSEQRGVHHVSVQRNFRVDSSSVRGIAQVRVLFLLFDFFAIICLVQEVFKSLLFRLLLEESLFKSLDPVLIRCFKFF